MVGLIDARSPEVYKLMTANKRSDIPPISAESWTENLQSHFVQPQESVSDVLPRQSNIPTRHQLLSDRLRSGQVSPSYIAVPPGPGGRYRSMNTTFQRSNEQAPVYELPPIHTLAKKNISNMNVQSSPGFDPFSTSFIKHAEKIIQDGRGKSHTENVLLPLLTDLFHLLLSDGVTPHLWHKVKITPLHKKGPITSPQNDRLLAINGCIYRLFCKRNVVRDLLTDWALAEEHQIPDSQFGFCPTRNTNQPLFILRHILATAKKKKMKVFTAFLDLFAAYNSVPREKLWRHLQKIKTPQYFRDIIRTMYTGCLYLLIDGDRISEEVAPNRGLKQCCPLSPLLSHTRYSLDNNDMDRFLTVQRGAATALDSVQSLTVIMLMTLLSLQTRLQLQLNKFYDYTRFKGLKLNTDKTKVMVFFSRSNSAIPTFTYDGTPLELVTEFKYLEITLTRDGSMLTAAEKMADKFRSAIARVYRIGDSKGIKHKKHAMLWLFQVFALTAGLYGCQVWATSSFSDI